MPPVLLNLKHPHSKGIDDMKNNIKLVAVDIDGTFGKRSNFKICANSSRRKNLFLL